MNIRAVVFCALMIPAALHAEVRSPLPPLLADPTRPPDAMLSADGLALGVSSGNRLTSIVLPQKGRPAAVVDGQVLRLGEKLGEARLTRIMENKVVLEGPEGIEHLYLTPDVEMKMNVTKSAARRKKE